MTSTKTVEQRLVSSAAKAHRDKEALQALREYQAEKARVDANTARLRALRLAKEAADAQAAAAEAPPVVAKKAAPRRAKASVADKK